MFVEYKTNVSRNLNMSKLQAGYLFPEVCMIVSVSVLVYFRFLILVCNMMVILEGMASISV